MASTVGSTAESTTDRVNQEGVNLCVTVMMQLIIRDPYVSVDEMMNYLLWIGPHGRVSRLMHMFGGRGLFLRTLNRMEIIRQATIQRRLHELPIDVERFDGTIPEQAGSIQLWAPQVGGGDPPFAHPPPGGAMQWEPLNRYPHEGLHSDDFWEEQDQEEEEDSMEGSAGGTASEAEINDDFNLARSEAIT